MTNEAVASKELWRLIKQCERDDETRDDVLRRVEAVRRIIGEHPKICEEECVYQGMLPLHIAVEGGAPLEIIKTVTEAYPPAIITKISEGETAIKVALTAREDINNWETVSYLLTRALYHLRSTLPNGWEVLQTFFMNHIEIPNVVQRLLDEFPP